MFAYIKVKVMSPFPGFSPPKVFADSIQFCLFPRGRSARGDLGLILRGSEELSLSARGRVFLFLNGPLQVGVLGPVSGIEIGAEEVAV